MLLRYKCAVCLELKFVAVFSVLIGQRVVPGSAATPSMAPVTTVFRAALPPGAFPAGLGIFTAREENLSGGVKSLPGQPTFAPQDLCLQSYGARGACTPLALGPQTSHTARFTPRSFHPLLITLERARTESADGPVRRACVISARRPPRPQQWIS